MIDLFGMGRQEPDQPQAEAVKDDAHPAPQEPAADAPPPRGSHRLWAFLLVLDSIFVIVFGGAVAAKVYQYWKEPAAVPAASARRHPAKPAEAPKPAEPAAPPAAAAAPAKPAPVAAKPAPASPPAPAKTAETPRPPKPSLLTEAPKPRATPSPAASAPAAPAPAAPAAPGKALPVVFKVRAPSAGDVQLVGAFIVHGGRKEMAKGADGVWSVKLYLNPGQYRYFFSVDKKKLLDPENPRSDRGASVVTVP